MSTTLVDMLNIIVSYGKSSVCSLLYTQKVSTMTANRKATLMVLHLQSGQPWPMIGRHNYRSLALLMPDLCL